jgi:hypothetical protein
MIFYAPISHIVKNFYTTELIYFPEYMPKPGDLNQAYFPYAKHTLNFEGLAKFIEKLPESKKIAELVIDSLFKKDKDAFIAYLKQSDAPSAKQFLVSFHS